jgi:dTMP kinase
MRREGRLVALEGVDGVGKSTLRHALAVRLRQRGWKVGLWREPTRASLGRTAQALGPTDPIGAAIHFTLDRLLARPRLGKLLVRNDIVLSDRSFYSTLAYQGNALRPSEFARLERLQRAVARVPDRVLWLDLPADESLCRVGGRGRARAPLERRATLRAVAASYRELSADRSWVRLDARRSPRELADTTAQQLDAWMRRRRVP